VPERWKEALSRRRPELMCKFDDQLELESVAALFNYVVCPIGIGREPYLLLIANRNVAYEESEQQELVDYGEILAALLSLKRQQSRTHSQYQQAHTSTAAMLQLLSRIMDDHDPFAVASGIRVAALSVAVGRELGLNAERIEVLKLAAQLHDLGHLLLPR